MSDLINRIMQEIRERREALDNRQATAERAAWANSPWWRAGRKVGRTVYARIAQGSDLDPLIGCMDSAVCVEHIVLNDPSSVLADISRQRAMLDGFEKLLELHQPLDDGPMSLVGNHCSCKAMGVQRMEDGINSIVPVEWPCASIRVVATALGIPVTD